LLQCSWAAAQVDTTRFIIEVVNGDTVLLEKPPFVNSRQYIYVERMPKLLLNEPVDSFIKRYTRYPADAKTNAIEGRVLVKFWIKEDGSINSLKVIRSLYPSLDVEAMRLVKLLPHWTPAIKNGKPIAMWYTLAINFYLK
jgi:protein TonB